jgi:hypothetical protein
LYGLDRPPVCSTWKLSYIILSDASKVWNVGWKKSSLWGKESAKWPFLDVKQKSGTSLLKGQNGGRKGQKTMS